VVSKDFDKVIEEAKELVRNGYKEIILSGIHTGKYGQDIDRTLTELVEELIDIEGLHRLRISSIEINEITDRLINLSKESEVLANHFHIPLQTGTDKVLKDMNRKYDTNFFRNRLNFMREINPNISITSDVIVGYPTETEELFDETVKFIEEMRINELHVFPFSKRNGTPAAKLKDLDKAVKTKRVRTLMELNKKLALEYAKKFEGKTLDIIVEHSNPVVGYTSNYLRVEGEIDARKGDIIPIEITDSNYPKSTLRIPLK
jgi:threonylcarbamoyladenosine tRNA methylthiotransferase MtaB